MATESESVVRIWNRALGKIGNSTQLDATVEDEGGGTEGEQCRLNWNKCLKETLEAFPWPFAKKQAVLTLIDDQSYTYTGDGVTTDFNVPFAYRGADDITVTKVLISSGAETELEAGTDYTLTEADAETAAPAYVTPTVVVSALYYLVIEVATERSGWEHIYSLPSDIVTPIALLEDGMRYLSYAVDGRPNFEIVHGDGDSLILCADLDEDEFEVLEYVSMVTYAPLYPAQFMDAVEWRLAIELALAVAKSPQLAGTCSGQFDKCIEKMIANSNNSRVLGMEPETPSLVARR